MMLDAIRSSQCRAKIENHTVSSGCLAPTYLDAKKYIEEIAKDLPDLEYGFAIGDHPQVAKHVWKLPFTTKEYSHFCDREWKPDGHSYFNFPYDLPIKRKLPIFSLDKVPQCHMDILMPASHFFDQPQLFDE